MNGYHHAVFWVSHRRSRSTPALNKVGFPLTHFACHRRNFREAKIGKAILSPKFLHLINEIVVSGGHLHLINQIVVSGGHL